MANRLIITSGVRSPDNSNQPTKNMTTIKTHKNKNGIEYYSTFNEDGEKIFSFSPSFDDIWSQEDQDEEHKHEFKSLAFEEDNGFCCY